MPGIARFSQRPNSLSGGKGDGRTEAPPTTLTDAHEVNSDERRRVSFAEGTKPAQGFFGAFDDFQQSSFLNHSFGMEMMPLQDEGMNNNSMFGASDFEQNMTETSERSVAAGGISLFQRPAPSAKTPPVAGETSVQEPSNGSTGGIQFRSMGGGSFGADVENPGQKQELESVTFSPHNDSLQGGVRHHNNLFDSNPGESGLPEIDIAVEDRGGLDTKSVQSSISTASTNNHVITPCNGETQGSIGVWTTPAHHLDSKRKPPSVQEKEHITPAANKTEKSQEVLQTVAAEQHSINPDPNPIAPQTPRLGTSSVNLVSQHSISRRLDQPSIDHSLHQEAQEASESSIPSSVGRQQAVVGLSAPGAELVNRMQTPAGSQTVGNLVQTPAASQAVIPRSTASVQENTRSQTVVPRRTSVSKEKAADLAPLKTSAPESSLSHFHEGRKKSVVEQQEPSISFQRAASSGMSGGRTNFNLTTNSSGNQSEQLVGAALTASSTFNLPPLTTPMAPKGFVVAHTTANPDLGSGTRCSLQLVNSKHSSLATTSTAPSASGSMIDRASMAVDSATEFSEGEFENLQHKQESLLREFQDVILQYKANTLDGFFQLSVLHGQLLLSHAECQDVQTQMDRMEEMLESMGCTAE